MEMFRTPPFCSGRRCFSSDKPNAQSEYSADSGRAARYTESKLSSVWRSSDTIVEAMGCVGGESRNSHRGVVEPSSTASTAVGSIQLELQCLLQLAVSDLSSLV